MFGIVDYVLLGIVLVLAGIILASYSLFISLVVRRRREKGLYSIIFSSVVTHFALWGISEFYLVNGYWYILGVSIAQTWDKIYWALAWAGTIIPIAVGFVSIILYFLAGYENAKDELISQYLNLLNIDPLEASYETAKNVLSSVAFTLAGANNLFDNESKKKIFFKSVLATLSGWGIGNIIQDRICGFLSLFVVKPEYFTKFSEAYWTLGGDLTAGLTHWILPILVFAIASLIYIYRG